MRVAGYYWFKIALNRKKRLIYNANWWDSIAENSVEVGRRSIHLGILEGVPYL